MRKLFVAVFALCIVAVMGPALFAGPIAVSSVTASAVFTSTGVVNVGFNLLNLIDGTTTTQIWWDPSLITGDVPSFWAGAGAYIVLYSTLSESNSGIEIYTDNRGPDASPWYSHTLQTWYQLDVVVYKVIVCDALLPTVPYHISASATPLSLADI